MKVYLIMIRSPYGTKVDSIWETREICQNRLDHLSNYHKGEPVLIGIEEYVVNEGSDQK